MIQLQTSVTVPGLTGKAVSEFMLNATDADYQRWWPGTHLAFHTLRRYPGDLGNRVYYDEFVGNYRLKFNGVLVEVFPSRKLTWQIQKIVRLPAWLTLEFADSPGQVEITHRLSVGFKGIGRGFDPILRWLISRRFSQDLDQHTRTEFHRLAEFLSSQETRTVGSPP